MDRKDNIFVRSNAIPIADAIPVGLAIANTAGELLFVNAELERMTGYSPDELLGQSVELLLPERNRAEHAAERAAFARAPAMRAMGAGRELFARRCDGSEFPVEVGLRPLECEGQRVILASIIDVSQRRQLESGLRAVLEAAPCGMVLADAQGRIVFTNRKLDMTMGYAEQELIGKPIEVLLPERQREAHVSERSAFARAPSQRSMGRGRDLTGRRKDGMEIPVEIGLSSVTTAEGRMSLAAVVDITERKRGESRLREANTQLEQFTYVASHDLRSPLLGIGGLIDFIREDLGKDASPGVLRNLERMQERVGRMERVIDDLLTYARAGKRSLQIERIDLSSVIDDIVRLDPVPAGKVLQIQVDVQPFEGARTPLTTVLRNLYSNAIKHHDRSDGSIAIRARESAEYCVIDVSDDGPGIPRASQDRVFKLFQTLTTSQRRGSGLGLAVAQRLTENHGGRMELNSADGERGCTFSVFWPRFMRSDLDV